MKSYEEAAAELHQRREALRRTCDDARARLTVPQLAEDAMGLLDPHLTLLKRLKDGVRHNRLLSLAVLAGVGWLVGSPRRRYGARPDAGVAPTRTTMKENNNDSGRNHGRRRSGSGFRKAERSQEPAPQAGVAQRVGEAREDESGLSALGRRANGSERNVAEQRIDGRQRVEAERGQQQPEPQPQP